MNVYGLVGEKLSHSYSPKIFKEIFKKNNIENAAFLLFELSDISLITELIQNDEKIKGLNITVPYKVSVLPYLTSLSDVAKEVGAVNCIKIIRGEKLEIKGYNTDVRGFEKAYLPYLEKGIKNALILGSGGASRSAQYVLKKWNINFTIVSRNPKNENQISYGQITNEIVKNHQMIIDCTPLGMYPNVEFTPDFPFHFLTKDHIVIDLVYNPEEPLFLSNSMKYTSQTMNGLAMLNYLAEESWNIWNE